MPVPHDWDVMLDAFDRECGAAIAVLDAVDEPEFARETNCPPWDLRELVVHICFSACTLGRTLTDPSPDAVAITAADYYRRAERSTEQYRTASVDNTQRVARRYPHGRDAVAAVGAAWQQTKSRLEALDPARLIAGPAGVRRGGVVLPETAIALADHTITRLVALAAHAADVAITLEMTPWTTDAALQVVTPTLVDLLDDRDPTVDLGWDARSFLLAATGRRPLNTDERRQLGPASDRFPLLS
jgi:hypothetical protein